MSSERLLGFDVRENFLTYRQLWNDERRSRYLIKDALSKPLSVDTAVWPSILDASEQGLDLEMPDVGRLNERLSGQANSPLWSSRDELRNLLQEWWPQSPCRYGIVAFEALMSANDKSWPRGMGKPAKVDSAWPLLGFDVVADQSMLSGVMNCGYRDEERVYAASRWSSLLNDHHLFESRAAAFEFAQWSDKRVPEHAPFSVWGLYSA